MKNRILLLLALTVTSILTMSLSQDKADKYLVNQIDNLLQWEEKFGFNGAVLVVKDGNIIFKKGYGFANQPLHLHNTPQTAFYVASVSKPFTALAIMKLVEQKRIHLQDLISNYLPQVPEDKKNITIEHLLTHTSGLKHTYSCDEITDRALAISTILNKTPLVSAVGTKYNYSGDNYTLLAAIIEITSRESFENYMTKNILQPAGINKSTFIGNFENLHVEDLASPIKNAPNKSLQNITPSWGRKGRAGMLLSVEDLYKFDKALMSNKLVPASVVEEILSPKISNSGSENYGFGFSLGTTDRGTKVFGHSGDDDGIGHNVDYLDFPEEKIKIFIASNSGLYTGTSWSAVISSLLQRMLFKSSYSYPADGLYYNEFNSYTSESVEKFEGVYEAGNTNYHLWINDKGALIVSPVGESVAGTFGFSKSYIEKNLITKNILEEAAQNEYSTLQNFAKDNTAFEKNKATIRSVWKSLTDRNGTIEKIEILGTANIWGGNSQSIIATWFKLIFKGKSQIFRMEWDANNKVAGLGGSRIPYPMMFTLNAIAKNEFIGFDAANGRTIAVNFLSLDKTNNPLLEINIDNNPPLLLSNSGDLGDLPKRSAAELLYHIITTQGIAAAVEEATNIKESKLDRFDVDEGELNDFGYTLLNDNKLSEAIAMFSILINGFPDSANGYDSLGEAYLKAGNKIESIRCYKRSLTLDPENEHAKQVIETLEGN